MVSSNALIACSCALASVVNVLVLNALLSAWSQERKAVIEPSHVRHSYIGTNVPLYLVQSPRIVALDVENSVHYDLGAFGDWEQYIPEHWQYKLGPRYQAFLSSIGHGTHCLNRLHRMLFPALAPENITIWHAQHCLNYLRQIILCSADTTLEPPDAFQTGMSGTHVCRDWTQVIDRAVKTNRDWDAATPFIEHWWR
ncbi:hypothetical protein AURDEDRAFT_169128 [Auricularia subglabra TFB-10046 SS5]|nr:hypothetical protein AURDEDRAFT_169128 [Auricularia subglabra TFB-10046 SS5]